jgi:hypothetical protein
MSYSYYVTHTYIYIFFCPKKVSHRVDQDGRGRTVRVANYLARHARGYRQNVHDVTNKFTYVIYVTNTGNQEHMRSGAFWIFHKCQMLDFFTLVDSPCNPLL